MAKGNKNPKTENLVSIGDMPREKQLEVTSAGGKARQEQRRKRKAMREQLEMLLSLPVSDDDAAQFEALGIDTDNMDNQMLMLVAMFQKVLSGQKGDVQAFLALRDTVGEKPTDKLEVGNANTDKLDSILRQLRED